MPEFPITLKTVTSRSPPRWIAEAKSATEILSLDGDGNKITKKTEGGWYGLYVWHSEHWELHEVFREVCKAERAADAIRKNGKKKVA